MFPQLPDNFSFPASPKQASERVREQAKFASFLSFPELFMRAFRYLSCTDVTIKSSGEDFDEYDIILGLGPEWAWETYPSEEKYDGVSTPPLAQEVHDMVNEYLRLLHPGEDYTLPLPGILRDTRPMHNGMYLAKWRVKG